MLWDVFDDRGDEVGGFEDLEVAFGAPSFFTIPSCFTIW